VEEAVTEPLAVYTEKDGEVEITAMKGEVPPVHETLTLPVLVAIIDGEGAAARAGTTAARRQAAAAISVLAL